MKETAAVSQLPLHRIALCALLLVVLAATGAAQANAPLPQDTGAAALKETLKRLNTTARLLHTDAHPDDEDGGMLVLESRGKGAEVTLLTLNRGEGGQNKIGSTLFDVLGVVRTLELLAADRYYGAQQRFTRVADFGFSKTPEETFQKWGGHDVPLRDMVRVIRTFRPDVIVSRFQGNDRDGHGHHQAAGILTREAFRAAADPTRFPEQIKEGLQPWQAKKLYIDNVQRFGQTTPPKPEEYTLALNTGARDPALGMSYVQFAMQGLKHQLSQGAGSWSAPSGPHLAYFRLVDSVLPMPAPGMHEKDFFDGIDITLAGLAARLGDEERKVPFLLPELQEMQQDVHDADEAVASSPAKAADPLLAGYNAAKHLIQEVQASSLSAVAKDDLVTQLETKRGQFLKAANLALGISMKAVVDSPATRDGFMAVRGGRFEVAVTMAKPSNEVKVANIKLDVPRGWAARRVSPIAAVSNRVTARFAVLVAGDAPYTRPCVHRGSVLESVYAVENDSCAVLPLPEPIVYAVSDYDVGGHWGQISAPVEVKFVQQDNSTGSRPVAVGPKFSVAVEPSMQLFRTGQRSPLNLRISGSSNVQPSVSVDFGVNAPEGWGIGQRVPFKATYNTPGEIKTADYQFTPPPTVTEGTTGVQGSITHEKVQYTEGYTLVTRPDIGSALHYQPAVERVSAIHVKLPQGLKVGYIMGAGDEIPSALQQLGMDVTVISPQELANGDLSKYGTIVLGIRVYDTRDDVRAQNKSLLDYVSNGGTLVVQYNANTSDLTSLAPFPLVLSRDRVTVEETPVEILDPGNDLFHVPNEISSRDFEGWVQERGLYFARDWDEKYHSLLSSQDPGEQPLKGGLLVAQYGKGTYIYTGYGFFRQLPMGVPGAVRLFVNLISAGHENTSAAK